MISTTILRVGHYYRVKFIGQCLRNGAFTEGYFAAEELGALRDAVERAQAHIRELSQESIHVESAADMFARYQEQLRRMVPIPD